MAAETEAQRITRLTPVEEALARIEALVEPVEPREVALEAALSRVLAEHVSAAGPLPARAVALRDGWAVAAGLTADAGSYAPALLDVAIRIDAGEPLPEGADAVASLDAVATRDGRAETYAPLAFGEGVLPAAADGEPQRPLLRAGRRLTAVEAALLAAAGIAKVRVRAPRIHVVRARSGPDPILCAAATLINRWVGAAGATPVEPLADDFATALNDPSADALIAIGGTGTGRNDASARTLAAVGRVEVHGIALLPGETAAFGSSGARPVLLIPGRFDAALAVWLTLGRALVRRLTGAAQEHQGTTAVLARKVASPLGMTELVPMRHGHAGAEPLASGYWPLQAIAEGDGWIEVPPGSEGYPAGAEVVVRPWP
jgi:molybdopterin biosynthesis enzyme